MKISFSALLADLDSGARGAQVVERPQQQPPSSSAAPQRSWLWWFAAIGWFVASSLAHLEFSLWLVSARDGPFGRFQFSDLVPMAATVGVFGLLICLYRQARACKQPLRLCLWWGVWFACVVVIDRHLTYSINELAHYPQYALLAWLLARAYDPERQRWISGRILFWTALLGMFDELQQYVWIAPAYGMHLDFNDILVNLVGAAAGVMLYYGANLGRVDIRVSPGVSGRPFVEMLVAGLLILAVVVLSASDRILTTPEERIAPGGWVRGDALGIQLYLEREAGTLGSVASGPRHGNYLILDPLRAVVFIALFGLLFARYPLWPWERRPAMGDDQVAGRLDGGSSWRCTHRLNR